MCLREFRVEAPGAEVEAVRSILREATDAKQVDDRLAASGLAYRSRILGEAAEDLPMDLLNRLSATPVGQSLLMQQAGDLRIYFVLGTYPAPVDKRFASDAIRGFIVTDKRRQEVLRGMKALRDSAGIQYMGVFAAESPTNPAVSAVR
jgi:hypothetical protein